MKLQQTFFAAVFFAGSLLSSNQLANASTANISRVRTVAHPTDQKKGAEKPQTQTPTSTPVNKTQTKESNCSQSQILKTTAWIGTGGTPK